MENNGTDDRVSSLSSEEIALSRSVRFWLFLGFEIPSMACSLFILYHFIMDPILRHSLHHHTIMAMNICAFVIEIIDIPFQLNFLLAGSVWPQISAYCLVWMFVGFGFYYTCCMLAAWASIERHIFVFHDQWLASRKGRLLAHYLPLVFIIVYMSSFYIVGIFFPPCDNTFDYTSPMCGGVPCYSMHPIIGVYDAVVHGCLTTLIITVFSIGLLIRLVLQKRRRRQVMQWSKHRKLTVQLLSITSIFIIVNLPIAVMSVIYLLYLPVDIDVNVMLYCDFVGYWVILFLPFVCLHSLPDMKKRIKNTFYISRRHQAMVGVASVLRTTNTALRRQDL
ncbi:unnamed protein product [Rotaria sp. Silwood2]|nr:unnamed protein product [Rotaria sp. Silwood2]